VCVVSGLDGFGLRGGGLDPARTGGDYGALRYKLGLLGQSRSD